MFGARKIAAAATLAAALALAACGDSEPEPSIPLENAEVLVGTLDEIRANVENGSCTVAAAEVQELEEELSQLPDDVDDEVRDGLQRGALNLGSLVDEQCKEPEPETTTEETEPETTTEETEPETTTEETEPTTTEETTTPPPNPGQGQGPGGTGGLGPSGGNP